MNKFEVDLNDVAFDSHGQQVGVEVPAEMLDEISGGRPPSSQEEKSNNELCGAGCGGNNNSTCGLSCLG